MEGIFSNGRQIDLFLQRLKHFQIYRGNFQQWQTNQLFLPGLNTSKSGVGWGGESYKPKKKRLSSHIIFILDESICSKPRHAVNHNTPVSGGVRNCRSFSAPHTVQSVLSNCQFYSFTLPINSCPLSNSNIFL